MGTSAHAYYARKAVPDFDVFGGIETTLAAARLVLGGVMERFPGLKFCFAHLGGVLPFLKERLDIGWTTGISFSYGERRFMNRITPSGSAPSGMKNVRPSSKSLPFLDKPATYPLSSK